MIAGEAQRRLAEAHLRCFENALANLGARADDEPNELATVEMDAVRALAADMRLELEDYDRVRSGR